MRTVLISLGIAAMMILLAAARSAEMIGVAAFEVGFYGLLAATTVVIAANGRCRARTVR